MITNKVINHEIRNTLMTLSMSLNLINVAPGSERTLEIAKTSYNKLFEGFKNIINIMDIGNDMTYIPIRELLYVDDRAIIYLSEKASESKTISSMLPEVLKIILDNILERLSSVTMWIRMKNKRVEISIGSIKDFTDLNLLIDDDVPNPKISMLYARKILDHIYGEVTIVDNILTITI